MKKYMISVLALLLLIALCIACCAQEQMTILALDHLREPVDELRMAAAEQAVAAVYPDVKCRIQYADQNDVRQYRGGKIPETADVLYLHSAELTGLIEQGEIASLSGNEKMEDLLAKLPDYGRLTGREGQIYALPRLLMVQMLRIGDRDALESLGIHTENLLWEQVFEAVPKLQAYNEQNGKSFKLLFDQLLRPTFLSQFYWDEMDRPSDAALREKRLTALVRGFLEMEKAGMLAQTPQDETVLVLNYVEPRTLNAGNYMLPPACIPRGRSAALSADFFVVRAGSDKRDAAMALLEGLFSEEAVSASKEYAESGVYMKGDEAAHFRSDAALALWQEGIALGYPQAPNENLAQMYTHWRAYQKRDMSFEDCIQAMLKQLP